ncbi:hypothetical protein C8Q79DRAFT_628337 [Trametes meyenii]|nr:hypothetical protein C8Q79DRAFT_628337 [Trametes meyenii]
MPDEPADGRLADHVIPRRAAARKASKLAAEQLESSPIPSDAERNGALVSFGEPSTPRSTVKVTYGSKRKYKQSPSESSPSVHAGPSQARPRAMSLVEQSPNKQKNDAASGRGAPRGRGGRKAKTAHRMTHSRASSIENLSEHPSETEDPGADEDVRRPSGSRHTALITSGKVVSSLKATNGHAPVPNAGSKKRPSSLSPSVSEGSLLTPLPSPQRETEPSLPVRHMPVLAPRLARQFMRSQTQGALVMGSSNKKDTLKQSKSFDQLLVLDSTDDESYDDLDVGSLVWVSIDPQGNLADCEDEGDTDTLWWPAKITLPRPCMRVCLFGTPPGHTDTGQRQLDVASPSPSNVRAMAHNGRIRFNETDYRPSRRRQSAQILSPQKKRKVGLDAAWRDARDQMVAADEAENGGISSILGGLTTVGQRGPDPFPSPYAEASITKSKSKGKARGTGKDSDVNEDLSDLDTSMQRAWHAPSADPLLEIPGELVLAKEGRTKTQYWPAKLLAYIKPQNPRQRPKYKVLFFDGTILRLEHDWFWTTTDDEFATCKLGESTGNYGLDSDVDDEDGEEDFNRPFAEEDEAVLRAPSPLPCLPAPPPEEFEYDLTISEQFEYVKPVLAAMLEGEYLPAKMQHDNFMRGAGARQKVLDTVPVRGSLSARDKEEVAFLVRSWVQRKVRRRAMGLNVVYPSDKLYASEGAEHGEANGQDDDDAESVLTPTSDLSGGDTEPLAPFEAEPPSSSFVATEGGETDDDERDGGGAIPDAPGRNKDQVDAVDTVPVGFATDDPTTREDVRPQHGDSEMTVAVVDVAREGGEKAAHGETLRPPPRTTFHDLDAVDEITYCNNVLLQEAILQLLLWRTGKRKTLGLLSPDEEQRLHDLALEEGAKTNWVHDIIRIRQAVERTMLPTGKGKDKASGSMPGLRPRARRGA